MGLPIGSIILFVLSLLIYFGIGHRVLDRMRLTDKGALVILGALIIGSFFDIPLQRGRIDLRINVGGALVPIGVAIYLLARAGTNKERFRAIIGALLTGGVIYYLGSVLMGQNFNEFSFFLDPLFITPIVAGLIAYLIGRSRRAAFVAATIGVLALDVIHYFVLQANDIRGTVHIGGAGVFDSIVLSGIIAVALAEIIGESRERLQGGPSSRLRNPQLLKNLRDVDYTEQNEFIEEGNQKGDDHE